MERFAVLAPAAFGVVLFLGALAIYTVLTSIHRVGALGSFKSNEVLGPFWAGFMVWFLRPLEHALIGARISPNALTAISLGLCGAAGISIASGWIATAAWLFIVAGILDMLDGRLARALGLSSDAGALFDSVADRWGEAALFAGFAWYLRDDGSWLLAAMLAMASSFMVSYTRARSEALGLDLRSGAMQRAERILLISVGMLVSAWLAAGESTAELAPHAIGLTLLVLGILSSATAIGRWVAAYRALVKPARRPVPATSPVPAVIHVRVGK